ncbi:MAG: hypothetical protein R2816_00835 [Flavobacteriaceae bacterium]
MPSDIKHAKPEELFCNSEVLKKQFLNFSLVEFGASTMLSNQDSDNSQVVTFNISPQPSFNKQFDLLIENLKSNHNKGYTNYLSCISEQQAKRFHDIFDDVGTEQSRSIEQDVHYNTFVLSLYQEIYRSR